MIIQPKIRGFICTTAHPVGCAASVQAQIQVVKDKGVFKGPKRVLVIGASTGYGLASRIAATFGAGAATIGVFFEKEADDKRTASPGWYNSAAFEVAAHADGHYAKSFNGDAFSDAMKQQVIEQIRQDWGKVDMVVYSLASPRRTLPDSGDTVSSVLKPIGQTFHGRTVDAFRGEVKDVSIEPATPEEIEHTVSVMGGDDWERWINQLAAADVLADGVITVAYSYLGPKLTHAIYKDGTIGRAKAHLKATADRLQQALAPLHGQAVVSVDKAVVTQASAAIPVVPLYIAILFKLMKAKGTHEGCIEQIDRLFREHLYTAHPKPRDEEGYIRIDDLEMDATLQHDIETIWPNVTTENLAELTDVAGYCDDFYRLFGFNMAGVNYEQAVDPNVSIPSLR
ncbi:MAG TPA: enoyl-ACP reductase FabV [Gammaproteobacteria bacterium]|jgi:enoyl-[acyl-carrier protein] reductase/trans-2-enoyl-CoA reductase (NAD+)|nr:enoyl-ACP reductase FabV [Gammaproteobacteria bacterium]